MPEPRTTAKPKMHGITPTPFEMPPGHLPEQVIPKSKRPLLISIVAIYYLIKAGVSLLLALVPWGDPESDLASYLTANSSLLFHSMPHMLWPSRDMPNQTATAYLQALPVVFLVTGVISGLVAYKMWTLSSRWRWGVMLWSGYSLCSTVRALVILSIIRSAIDIPLPPVSAELKAALLVSMAWNLLVVCYLAFYPGVREAFEEQPY
jgi:hypothetical protein